MRRSCRTCSASSQQCQLASRSAAGIPVAQSAPYRLLARRPITCNADAYGRTGGAGASPRRLRLAGSGKASGRAGWNNWISTGPSTSRGPGDRVAGSRRTNTACAGRRAGGCKLGSGRCVGRAQPLVGLDRADPRAAAGRSTASGRGTARRPQDRVQLAGFEADQRGVGDRRQRLDPGRG